VYAYRPLKQKVESVMTGEGKVPLISLASALYTISLFYGAGLKLREFAYRRRVLPSRRLPCKVICVGNITVGGTGKTPMAMHVAQEIKNLGY
jgi:tetraacyldisaccharide 4'-kinase